MWKVLLRLKVSYKCEVSFSFNISAQELFGEKLLASQRVQALSDSTRIDTSGRVHAISDGHAGAASCWNASPWKSPAQAAVS